MNGSNTTHHITGDGSSTLCSKRFGAHYHSMHGAITESEHIFINAGLRAIPFKTIDILEIGFGTGLNAALSVAYIMDEGLTSTYHALELYPLAKQEYILLNYADKLPSKTSMYWEKICHAPWNERVPVSSEFFLHKHQCDFTQWQPQKQYHVIYFDAFAPDDQPEMWTQEQFDKLYSATHCNGCLVTYCVKGIVKRSLTQAGFSIERLPGPPGKRHILRAWRK